MIPDHLCSQCIPQLNAAYLAWASSSHLPVEWPFLTLLWVCRVTYPTQSVALEPPKVLVNGFKQMAAQRAQRKTIVFLRVLLAYYVAWKILPDPLSKKKKRKKDPYWRFWRLSVIYYSLPKNKKIITKTNCIAADGYTMYINFLFSMFFWYMDHKMSAFDAYFV